MKYPVAIIEEVKYEVYLDAKEVQAAIEGAKGIVSKMHSKPYNVVFDIERSNVIGAVRIEEQ